MGIQYNFHPKYGVKLSTGYNLLGYDVQGNLGNLKSKVTRPLSDEIPIDVAGRINYSFWDIGLDFVYNFNSNSQNGIFASIGVDYLIHFKTNCHVDVTYETGLTDTHHHIPEFTNLKINDLIFTNLKLGYRLALTDRLTFVPSVGINFGLNEISDDTISPF